MIDTYLQQAMAVWPTELHQIGEALRLVLPVLLVVIVLWPIARGLQWLIDQMDDNRPAPMRTADVKQAQRDVDELLWRGSQGFENTYPLDERQSDALGASQAAPAPRSHPPVRVRAGRPAAPNPFPQPSDERRRP